METKELWMPALGFEGSYEVSDHGRIRSLDRMITDSRGREYGRKGKILSPPTLPNGYVHCMLSKGVRKYVHRLVLEAFVGPCPDGMEACHGDGVRTNNALRNLRWDTRSENHRDKVRHGTHSETRKTECPMGHPLSSSNNRASMATEGHRACLACSRARGFARYRNIPFTKELADEYYTGARAVRRYSGRKSNRTFHTEDA